MIFWLLKKEGDRNTFILEYTDKKSAYDMADFLNRINPTHEHWVLEIN